MSSLVPVTPARNELVGPVLSLGLLTGHSIGWLMSLLSSLVRPKQGTD